MTSPTTLSTTEARKRIFEITNAVQTPGLHFMLTENGTPKAVVLSADEYDSWAETLETISDIPTILADVEDAQKDYKSGRVTPLEDLAPKPSYAAPRRSRQSRA